jgi:hypothetical protein
MHPTGTFRGTARKREGAARKHQSSELKAGTADRKLNSPDRKRVETVVTTLATLSGHSETLSEVAHDARNMVTALGLYCDLLDEPGVLATPFMHYGHELRLVAAASRRLVEKIVAIDAELGTPVSSRENHSSSTASAQPAGSHPWAVQQGPECAVGSVAAELVPQTSLFDEDSCGGAANTSNQRIPGQSLDNQATEAGSGAGICYQLPRSRTWRQSCSRTAICWLLWQGPRSPSRFMRRVARGRCGSRAKT